MKVSSDTAEPSASKNIPFAFGANWVGFLSSVDQARIDAAERSLQDLFHAEHLQGCRFLDAGCGSGLFSLAASRLGADVTSFDADPDSVACTQELKTRFWQNAGNWHIVHGSLLDQTFLSALGEFNIVYCWGVAHHTGNMWVAIENLSSLVQVGGLLVLAIYNDQLYISRAWRSVKRIYQQLPAFIRPLFVVAIGSFTFAKRLAVTMIACMLRLLTLRNPFVPIMNWARETRSRGMHGWYNLVDWVGGWPFEVAKPEEVFRFLRDRGFVLQELTTSMGHGCNEFLFSRTASVEG